MAIFGVLESDPIVQIDDKVRLKAVRSFVSKDEAVITLVEIEPEASSGFIDVTGASSVDWYLDWAYAGISRTVTVTLRITTDGGPVTSTLSVSVVTAADDRLFSTDADLLTYETEIMDLLPDGYSSFNFQHRKAQKLILDWFSEEGYHATDGTRLTAAEFLDNDEVRKWSEAWTLALIYNDNWNSVDDKFKQTSDDYKSLALDARKQADIKIDFNKDGEITPGEFIRPQSLDMFRR